VAMATVPGGAGREGRGRRPILAPAVLDIDRPLRIPTVSVYDCRVSLARFHGTSVPAGSTSSSPSPRASTAGGLKAPAAPTRSDGAGARPI
jgi:hypothetical protein